MKNEINNNMIMTEIKILRELTINMIERIEILYRQMDILNSKMDIVTNHNINQELEEKYDNKPNIVKLDSIKSKQQGALCRIDRYGNITNIDNLDGKLNLSEQYKELREASKIINDDVIRKTNIKVCTDCKDDVYSDITHIQLEVINYIRNTIMSDMIDIKEWWIFLSEYDRDINNLVLNSCKYTLKFISKVFSEEDVVEEYRKLNITIGQKILLSVIANKFMNVDFLKSTMDYGNTDMIFVTRQSSSTIGLKLNKAIEHWTNDRENHVILDYQNLIKFLKHNRQKRKILDNIDIIEESPINKEIIKSELYKLNNVISEYVELPNIRYDYDKNMLVFEGFSLHDLYMSFIIDKTILNDDNKFKQICAEIVKNIGCDTLKMWLRNQLNPVNSSMENIIEINNIFMNTDLTYENKDLNYHELSEQWTKVVHNNSLQIDMLIEMISRKLTTNTFAEEEIFKAKIVNLLSSF